MVEGLAPSTRRWTRVGVPEERSAARLSDRAGRVGGQRLMSNCKECARLYEAKVEARHQGDMSKVTDIVILIARHKKAH